MKRSIKTTADGSHTFHVTELGESYHSMHGAKQESLHVFINEGLRFLSLNNIRILETGFGTGLNAALTYMEAEKTGRKINYHSVELYPLNPSEYLQLNYFEKEDPFYEAFIRIHECRWNRNVHLSDFFSITKLRQNLLSCLFPGKYDLVYFDAFSPRSQPELWTEEIFKKVHNAMIPGAVLVTYCAKGKVRRNIEKSGLSVEKIPGPPGKREMIRAVKLS